MISGINLSEQIEYVLPDDKDNPTVWKLGVLSSFVMGQMAEKGVQENKMAMMFKVCQVGIKGWTNLNGIEYSTVKEKVYGADLDVVPIAILEKIPVTAIGQLALKILEINKITEEQRKN